MDSLSWFLKTMAQFLPPKPYYLQPGTTLGMYELLGVIGQGGFALTYLARDQALNREVVVKEYFPSSLAQRNPDGQTVVPTNEDSYEQGLGFFYQEAEALSQLQHPHVAEVLSVLKANDTAYIVMPYYTGTNLEDWLNEQPELLEEREAFDLLKPVLKALDYVHGEGVIHRDIKPANILLAKRGNHQFPVLLDFGGARQFVANATHTYDQILSPGYAPFEQYFKQGKQGPWTDVYACAAVLYRMVMGEAPPDATSRKSGHELDLSGFTQAFAAVIEQAMSQDGAKRFQTVLEFEQACETALRVPAGKGATRQHTQKNQVQQEAKPKKLLPIFLSAFAGLLVVGGAGWYFFLGGASWLSARLAGVSKVANADELASAVQRAKAGTTIELAEGTYVLSNPLEITQPLSLKGLGQQPSALQFGGGKPLIHFAGDGTLELFNVALSYTGTDPANVIEIERGDLKFERGLLEGAVYDETTGQGGRGLLLAPGVKSATLTQVFFQNNAHYGLEASGATQVTIADSGFQKSKNGGLLLAGQSVTTITETKILGNNSVGIEVKENASATLRKVEFTNNGASGIYLSDKARVEANDVTLMANRNGATAEGSSTLTVKSSNITQNLELGIYYVAGSQGSVEASTISQNLIGLVIEGGASQNNNQFSENGTDVEGP